MNQNELNQFLAIKGTPPSEIKLRKKIDVGGVSDIWLASHPKLDHPFVVKYAKSKTADNHYLFGQFEREYEVSQALIRNHAESCTTVVADFDTDILEHPYLYIEYFPAKPLDALMPHLHMWSQMHVILKQLIQLLSTIHAVGIVHRDIKPANIIISKQGEARIIDFALATIDGNWHKYHTEGLAIGTPLYMSPEQAYGKKILLTSACDWYALGISLYEWISGNVPFHGNTPVETIRMHCFNPAPPLVNNHIIDLPDDMLEVVPRLICKEPNARFSAVRDLRKIVCS